MLSLKKFRVKTIPMCWDFSQTKIDIFSTCRYLCQVCKEKINPDDFVKSINDKIAYVAEESEPMEIEAKEEKMDIEKHE